MYDLAAKDYGNRYSVREKRANMNWKWIHAIWFNLAFIATSAMAQTAVTTSGGTANTIPAFTAASTIGNSPIAVSSGNVGIGTIGPGYQLEIDQTPGSDIPIVAFFNNRTPGSGNQTHGISVLSPNASGSGALGSTIEAGASRSALNLGYMAFVSKGSGLTSNFLTFGLYSEDEVLNISGTGNVGIGTTSPTYTLDVNGTVHASSGVVYPDGTVQTTAFNPTVCGGDYAESVDVSGDRTHYGPGDVLVIDPDHTGKFLQSSEPYSSAVMGIYSTKPGVIGRRQTTPKSDDEIPMAMIGIVPTKVSAENGPINPGDLLVTSSTPGYAMKGTDRGRMLGAVIGKALGHLDSGTGVIEVGVTLQ